MSDDFAAGMWRAAERTRDALTHALYLLPQNANQRASMDAALAEMDAILAAISAPASVIDWKARAERAEAELAKASELIAMLEGEQERADNLSDKLEIERALTDGAHRRAKVAEALLKEAVEALGFYKAGCDWQNPPPHCDRPAHMCCKTAYATLARIQGDSHDG